MTSTESYTNQNEEKKFFVLGVQFELVLVEGVLQVSGKLTIGGATKLVN